MSMDLGDRLLKAFDTGTGIPHSRVNLKYGADFLSRQNTATCTACAGTLLLEFAALSRFTGVEKYETAARKAMDALWSRRAFSTNLVGETINITNGLWTRTDSGVGAGIDSYYEYLLKAHVMLGDEGYHDMFQIHYDSIMKLLRRGPFIFHANMHQPNLISRRFLDSLQMFWPGLQVLYGDVGHAVEMHRMHHQLTQRYEFLPEGYTPEMKIHWGNWPLRPEFIESTYFLYRATKNPFYLQVGKDMLESIKRHTKVRCGFAAILDVRKMNHEDKMDSFFLAETFKYLYLLFTDPADLPVDVDQFVFTTEAHMFPLSLSQRKRSTPAKFGNFWQNSAAKTKFVRKTGCPAVSIGRQQRREFLQMVRADRPKSPRYRVNWNKSKKKSTVKMKPTLVKMKVDPSELDIESDEHIAYLFSVGIQVERGPEGVKLIHNPNSVAGTVKLEGLKFMQEMIKLSKAQESKIDEEQPMGSATVVFSKPRAVEGFKLIAGLASFGFDLEKHSTVFTGEVVLGKPFTGCGPLQNSRSELANAIVMVQRGQCMFVEKAREIERSGGSAMIVMDNTAEKGPGHDPAKMFTMRYYPNHKDSDPDPRARLESVLTSVFPARSVPTPRRAARWPCDMHGDGT